MTDSNLTPEDLRKKSSAPSWQSATSPSSWIPLNLADSLLVQSLETVKDTFVPVVTAAKTIIEIVKTLIEAALNLIVSAADLGAEAIKAAIAAVRALLEDLLDVGSFYTLFVPIGRTDLETTGKIMTDAFLGGDPYPETAPMSGADLLGSGGNHGFLQTVIDSLEDNEDPNRPQFSQDAHIAAAALVFGTTNLYELYELVDKLVNALRIPGAKSYYKPTAQPRGLRAVIVPSSYGTRFGDEDDNGGNTLGEPDSEHPYAVKLEWEHEDKVVDVDDNGIATSIQNVMIYRAEDPDQLNPSQPPVQWRVHEIARMTFDELTNEFFDNTITTDSRYTYGVGFELSIEDADENEITTFVRAIKTVRVSTANIRMPATRGVPPDWVKYNLLDMLFPQAREFVEKYLIKFLDSLEDSLSDITESIREYVEFLEEEIDRYSEWVQDILDRITELIEVLTWPRVYAGATMIFTEPTLDGGGGNRFFISQLAAALTDKNDSNRPPFDSGSEAVAGMVLLAGSESAGTIKRFRNFLETFLGSAGNTAISPVQEAFDSIDYLTREAERQLCLSPAFEATVCTTEASAGNSFDAAFEPASEAAECAK